MLKYKRQGYMKPEDLTAQKGDVMAMSITNQGMKT